MKVEKCWRKELEEGGLKGIGNGGGGGGGGDYYIGMLREGMWSKGKSIPLGIFFKEEL